MVYLRLHSECTILFNLKKKYEVLKEYLGSKNDFFLLPTHANKHTHQVRIQVFRKGVRGSVMGAEGTNVAKGRSGVMPPPPPPEKHNG
jgi:hypothetical protein